jgi:polysaccharide biosynthesis/export protein
MTPAIRNTQRNTASLKLCWLTILMATALITGCSSMPSAGPSKKQVEAAGSQSAIDGVQIIDVTEPVARQLLALKTQRLFSEVFGTTPGAALQIGAGDTVEVSVWEAPPATLFGASGEVRASAATGASRVTTLPEQIVSTEGMISVPFVGAVRAAGRSPTDVEKEITARLKAKANQPQVLVRLLRNSSSTVTVVGDVTSSVRVPLTPRGERVLDALAAAGGVRQPVGKITLQVTRGDTVQALPLEAIITDPKQNVPLKAGDVVTALFQPLSFTALGATGKNEEVNFEAQGISLAQAMARSGGVQDARADAQGVFIFRLEKADALTWPRQPVRTTVDGRVPVIYRINLRDPATFFVSQTFQVQNKDLLYVANAPATELQKFLNVVFSIAYPITTTRDLFRN